ncbi:MULTISPECIES: hypothetical protein [unclassified Halorubrum]|uniref:hypothetical protein n=1 Tax=unclassified Halorubrum TaxID=2642239 RepID=UPI000B98D869|nr:MULTISPECIES: hypothetical protein [unclassified Halorubrum]OYR46244.1 hypothetical protein DJ75_06260 [Halorubrum sp. Eb13]OYR54518.1 hypothetical protein DJ73_04960 [Halorubrum sp. Ea1]
MIASREIPAERGLEVPLRVDYVADDPAEPTSMVYCTDIEGTELRVAVQEPSATESSLETGKWYRFDRVVRSRSLGAQLLFPSGNSGVERIEAPEPQTHPPLAELDTPWLVQLGASDERIAVTVQPRPTDETGGIRVEDPETYEIAAVCFAYCDRSSDATVYHREEPDTRDEQLLLEHVVEDLSEAEGATLVTRGYDRFPLEMLYQRLAQASGGDVVGTGAERVLNGCFHATPESVPVRSEADTVVEAARQLGIEVDPVLLSDYDIGIDRADWRGEVDTMPLSDVSDPRMTDGDYATLVERYLGPEDGSVDSAQLAHCLKAYASADLGLLRELVAHGTMDRLGCPRLSERRLKR